MIYPTFLSRAISHRNNELFGVLALLTGMKTNEPLYLALLLIAGTAGGMTGQPFATNTNPALSYYQAFDHVPDFPQKDRDYLNTNVWPGQKLPDRFGELVAEYDTEFRFLRRAAHSTVPCDWGLDWSAGPGTLLSHLPRIKAAAVAARLRIQWDLQY